MIKKVKLLTRKKIIYKIMHVGAGPVSAQKTKYITNLVGAYCIHPKISLGVAVLGDPHFEEITKIKGEPQMTNHVTVEAVTHTHTHTQANLINNKKINIYAIFMYFSYRKNI